MGGAAMLTAGYIDVNPLKAKIVSGISCRGAYRLTRKGSEFVKWH